METPEQTQARWDCDMTRGFNPTDYKYTSLVHGRNKQKRTFRKGVFLGLLIGVSLTLGFVLLTGGGL